MGILDEVKNMKKMGMEEAEISNKLQEKGVTPKAIDDAFNQMQIKKAVSAESQEEGEMKPSIMQNSAPAKDGQPAPIYTPKTQEVDHESQEDFYAPQQSTGAPPAEYAQQDGENYYPQENYANYENEGENYDTNTLIEIAEQVFLENIKKEQKKINSLNEFAALAETKISDHHERIKKMESIMNKLQIAILEKIGSYGKDLNSIKNEMGMMQESFGKMTPSMHEKHSVKHTSHTKKKSSKSKK